MELLDIVKRHVAYTSANDVTEICKPLFETVDLNFFGYSKKCVDGSLLTLTTNRESLCNTFQKKYPLDVTKQLSGVHLFESYMTEEMIRDEKELGLYSGITIFKQNEAYTEVYFFAAPETNRSVIDFYFNHLDVLEKFIFYFKDKAHSLIEQAKKERFIIPNYLQDKNNIFTEKSYGEFCELLKSKRVYLNLKSREVMLTRREYEVLLQFTQGRTTKEVAKVLNISPRTAESHLENAKNKTNCTFKSQLIDMLRDNFIAACHE